MFRLIFHFNRIFICIDTENVISKCQPTTTTTAATTTTTTTKTTTKTTTSAPVQTTTKPMQTSPGML